jgi:hypothetical protein
MVNGTLYVHFWWQTAKNLRENVKKIRNNIWHLLCLSDEKFDSACKALVCLYHLLYTVFVRRIFEQ